MQPCQNAAEPGTRGQDSRREERPVGLGLDAGGSVVGWFAGMGLVAGFKQCVETPQLFLFLVLRRLALSESGLWGGAKTWARNAPCRPGGTERQIQIANWESVSSPAFEG